MSNYFKLFFLLIFCAVSISLSAQRDFLGIPSINLGENEYLLKWSSKTKSGRYLEEFIAHDDNITKYKVKLILECTTVGKTLDDEVREMLGKLALKKEENIVFSFQQIESAIEGELWIEYVQGNVQGGQPFTLEWNLNRYKLVDGRVILFRVIHKVYDKELDDFMKIIHKKKENWLREIMNFDINKVQLKENK